MSKRVFVAPIIGLRCDHEKCPATFYGSEFANWAAAGGNLNALRGEAREKGWATTPPHGRGTRRNLDLCADHLPKDPTWMAKAT